MYHYNRIYNKHDEAYLHKEKAHIKRFLYYLQGLAKSDCDGDYKYSLKR